MLRSARELYGHTVRGTDGDLGKLHDVFLVEPQWAVRYLEVDVGHWFGKHRVFVSPELLGKPDWLGKIFPVSLTRQELEANSPNAGGEPGRVASPEPLNPLLGWPMYWTGWPVDPASAAAIASSIASSPRAGLGDQGPKHAAALRSGRVVLRCNAQATDGNIGRIHDLLVDEARWLIRYVVVDAEAWWPGRQVLVAASWLGQVSWLEEKVFVRLTQHAIRRSPAYVPSVPVDRNYEERLFDHYGRAKYWEMEAEPVHASYPCRQCDRIFLSQVELQAHLDFCPAKAPRRRPATRPEAA